MMEKKLIAMCCVCVMLVLLGLAGAAQAGTVQYAIQSDGTITHEFYYDKDSGVGSMSDRLAATWWVTSPFPGLTADFSQDKTLQVTFAAPEGKAFRFIMPSGAYYANLSFQMDSHDSTSYPYEDGAVMMEWLGLHGTEPSFTPTTNSWGIGSQTVWLQSYAEVTNSFFITGFKVTFTVPADFTVNWEDLAVSSGNVTFTARSYDWTTDPGQMVTLIPEPATMLLLGFGMFGLLKKRRA